MSAAAWEHVPRTHAPRRDFLRPTRAGSSIAFPSGPPRGGIAPSLHSHGTHQHTFLTQDAATAGGADSDYGSDIDDGFGSDLMGDLEDRAALMAMNELEREVIISERAEKRDAELARRRTARLAAGGRPTGRRGRAAAAAAAAAPDRAAARSKQPEASARRTAAAELREAHRAAAAVAAARAAARARSEEPGVGDDYTTRPGRAVEEEDGYESGEDARGLPPPSTSRGRRYGRAGADDDEEDEADAEPASHAEAVAAQVRRAQLARWLGEPHAGRTLPGTLIRLAYKAAYMVGEVIEAVDRPPGTYRDGGTPVPTPYELTAGALPPGTPASAAPGAAPPGRSIRTSTWLKVARGASTRLFPATLVSNAAMSEEEWESHGRQLKRDGRRPWARSAARDAAAAIAAGAAYTYTADDVKAMVAARRAAGGGPRNRAVERTRLATLHAAAVQAGETAEAARLAADLEALDAAATKDAAARAAAAASSLDAVNRRNAERNLANSLKGVPGVAGGAVGGAGGGGAGGGGGLGASEDGDGADGAGGGAATADPFRRRETRPRHMWATGGGRRGGGDGEGGAKAEDAAAAPAAPPAVPDTPAEAADPRVMYAPVLGLDLTRLATAPAPPKNTAEVARGLLGPAWAPPVRNGAGGAGGDQGGRKFTLEDYFRRRQEMGS